MDENRLQFSYLFSTSEPLLSQDAISRISVPKVPLQKDDTVIENDDTDLLSHSDMSWETMEDRYMLFEIASNDSISTTSKSSSNVILDEHSNVIVEDEQLRRKRHQAKLLQRRNTLIRGIVPSFIDELSESSEELLTRKSPEMEKPEHMKDFYTDLILNSRKMYLDQHVNKPGFFSLVLLSDDYFKAFNKLINFIYELYTNYSFQEPKFLAELNHFSKIAIPAMIDPIIDEIKQSLSTPILQRRTLLRMYGVTSWKDLMPSQIVEDSTNVAD